MTKDILKLKDSSQLGKDVFNMYKDKQRTCICNT